MSYKRALLALGFGTVGLVAVGLLAIPLQAEEAAGALCCEYSSECPPEFPQCNIVGADCSGVTPGNQGYCMKGGDLEDSAIRLFFPGASRQSSHRIKERHHDQQDPQRFAHRHGVSHVRGRASGVG
jgi:hypothetical protein